MEPNEFINIKYHLTDTFMLSITKDASVTIKFEEEIDVLNIENIGTNGNKINIPFSKEDKNIIFKGIGSGIYSVKIRFKDGNIIDYIFI